MEQLQIFDNGEQAKKKLVNLNFKQIKMITHGALEIYDDMGGFTFSRFTPAQIEHYSQNPIFKSRAQQVSGVHFDFYTDSQAIEIDFLCIENVDYQPRASFDILENGALCHTIPSDFKAGKSYSVKYTLENKGRTRLTVYLPNSVQLIVKRVALTEDCEITPVKHSKKMLILGDSITQGQMVKYTFSSYANCLARMFDVELLNQAVSGHYYDAASLDGGLSFGADYITVAYGTNDKKHNKNIKELKSSAESYIKKLTTMFKKAKFFVVVPWWRVNLYDENSYIKDFHEVRAALFETLEKYPQVTVIDGFSANPHLPEFFPDARTHPGHEAHLFMALSLASEMRKYIK